MTLLCTWQNIQSMCSKNQEKHYQTKIVSNTDNYPTELLQQGADTLMILQAKNVFDMQPFPEIYILSAGTDMPLSLVHFYPQSHRQITKYRRY